MNIKKYIPADQVDDFYQSLAMACSDPVTRIALF